MEESNKNKPNYKIWHFGRTKWDKIAVERFYAKNDEKAYEHLEEFKKNNLQIDGKEYYYSTICYVRCVDSKGNKSEEHDIEDHKSRALWYNKDKSWLKKAWEEVMSTFSYWFFDKPKDWYYRHRDKKYLLKNKEAYSNQWNLDSHLLDSIELNVPSLIKNSHSLAFLDEAIVQMHGHEPGFDLDKFYRDNYMGYPKELEELALKIQNEEYNKLLLNVKLYKYYSSFGSIDFDNKDDVEFDKVWRRTLPIKKGTYDEISDYKELIKLTKDSWNSIWDWMKAYGQKLND